MKHLIITAFMLFASIYGSYAESKTFIREYYYQAGENDSKISSRNKALTEVKRLLLEEIGVYMESYINYSVEQSGNDVNNQFIKKEIEQISAGITETAILDENWTGAEYYIKAQITVDPDDVLRKLNNTIEHRKASVIVDSLNMLLTEANTSIKAKESEINTLRTDLENEQQKLRRQEEKLKSLNDELTRLKSQSTQFEQQEKAVQTEIDKIKASFAQKTSKASQVMVGMSSDDVLRLCGQPRSYNTLHSTSALMSGNAYLSSVGAWNYGDITIILNDISSPSINNGLVIKGIRTTDLDRNGGDPNLCDNILDSMYDSNISC